MKSQQKAQLLEETQTQEQLQREILLARQTIRKATGTLQELKAVQEDSQAKLQQLQAETAATRAEQAKGPAALIQLRQKAGDLRAELARREKDLEQSETNDARIVKAKLVEVLSGLKAVHEELRLLSSEAAKKAACEAAGGDIPTTVVPAPVLGVEAVDQPALWTTTSADAGAPTALQDALQTQVVLCALQRSLTVRATELREGLRQYGFAMGATKGTEELCRSLKEAIATGQKDLSSIETETMQMQAEFETDSASLSSLQAWKNELDARHGRLQPQLAAKTSQATKLQERRKETQSRIEEMTLSHARLEYQHEENGQQHTERSAEFSQLSLDSSRRVAAADRLVRRSREQAQKAANDVEQAKKELASFQKAHSDLQAVHISLARDREVQGAALELLQDENEQLNLDLNGLARHYMELLPSDMGGGFESAPVSPARSAQGGFSMAGTA